MTVGWEILSYMSHAFLTYENLKCTIYKWGLFYIEVIIEYYESIINAYSLLDLLFMSEEMSY